MFSYLVVVLCFLHCTVDLLFVILFFVVHSLCYFSYLLFLSDLQIKSSLLAYYSIFTLIFSFVCTDPFISINSISKLVNVSILAIMLFSLAGTFSDVRMKLSGNRAQGTETELCTEYVSFSQKL